MSATATIPATPPTSRLIRRLDGVEWPATGTWRLPPSVALDVHRRQRFRSRGIRVPIHGGTLVVHEHGLHSTLDLHLAPTQPLATAGLTLHAVVTAADGNGTWGVSGSALVDDVDRPLVGTVRYCGVYRTVWRATLWLEVSLTVPRQRGVPQIDVAGQLDALAPDLSDARAFEPIDVP
jgi:hypothetical protein